jgi:hypothetical protein
MNMSKLSIDSPNFPVPPPFRSWEELDALQIGDSLTFPASLYTEVNNAVCYRTRKYAKKFTRRHRGDTLTIWRLA